MFRRESSASGITQVSIKGHRRMGDGIVTELNRDAAELIAEIKRVAAETPNFVFHGQCRYVINDDPQDTDPDDPDVPKKPGCIVGVALWNLGWIDANLSHRTNVAGATSALQDLNVCFTPNEGQWISDVQFEQDMRTAWGAAVDRANRLCNNGVPHPES